MDKTNLTWNVYVGDSNAKEVKIYNIFNHGRFLDDLKKLARSYKDTQREEFCEHMRKDLMYYYWSKCEWEVIIDHWPHWDKFNDRKVDVYSQVRMNWEPFCDYVWKHRAVLRRREKKEKKESTTSRLKPGVGECQKLSGLSLQNGSLCLDSTSFTKSS